MKNFTKTVCLLFFLFLSIILFHGCCNDKATGPVGRVVVKIKVNYENGPLKAYREYTAADKMQYILNYLRYIDPYGTPNENPETISGNEYRIALVYPNGQEKIYRQKSDRFMQMHDGSWKKINPQKAQKLAEILGYFQSDTGQIPDELQLDTMG